MKLETIDARRAHGNPEFREYTLAGAIAGKLEGINPGASIQVHSVIDPCGEPVSLPQFRTALQRVTIKTGRRFITRTKKGQPGAITVFRIE